MHFAKAVVGVVVAVFVFSLAFMLFDRINENHDDKTNASGDASAAGDNSETATTTRYYDCSGGACGCGYGDPGNPNMCHANALTSAPAGNVDGALFYGTAAVSAALGGGNWDAAACGKCFKLVADSNVPGYTGSKTIVVKATNFCPSGNAACENGKKHFDVGAPGFDYPSTSLANSCASGEAGDQGMQTPQTCAYWMINSQDPQQNCNCDVISDLVLRQGCKNFLNLGWNNPSVNYKEVTCPTELAKSPPCWHDNGGQWPATPSASCAGGV